jgi:hypothetical protein
MKREVLSFLIATGFVLGIFVVNYAIKRDDGYAYASTANLSGSMMRDNREIPNAHKRELRQKISANSNNILDLSGREIYSIFSQPELIRTDAPTTIWQYRTAACVLDIYYTTRETTALRAPAVHYEIRAREKGIPDEAVKETCMRDLVRVNAGVNLVNINAVYKAN